LREVPRLFPSDLIAVLWMMPERTQIANTKASGASLQQRGRCFIHDARLQVAGEQPPR
jgi:hypothetical protein